MDEKALTAVSTSLALMQNSSQCATALGRTSHAGCPHQGRISAAHQRRRSDGRARDHGGHKSRIYEGRGTAIIDLALILQLSPAAHPLGNVY
jgi:hypothetical protein